MSNYIVDTAGIQGATIPVFRSIENPAVPLSQAEFLSDGRESSSGVKVSRRSALSYDAVWRAVNLICMTVAKLPLHIYRRDGEGKRRATEHPAYRLLRREPNPDMTSFVFRQVLQSHALLEGNGYAYIFRAGSGEPKELVLLDPTATYPVRFNGSLWYVTTVNGEMLRMHADDVLHIKGLGFDGLCGYSVLSMARESLGLGLAARKFGSVFFKNGSKASGVLMYPGRLKDDAIKSLRKSWEQTNSGLSNAHKLAILEEGVKYQQLTIPPNDAQFLETRAFSRVEVANWFNVPPHKVGDGSKSSYNSLEQENQSFLDEGLDGWLVPWEEECWKKLLSEAEKQADTHTVEYLREALLRANLAARGSYYRTAVTTGWMSRDEVRARENMNPIPNGEGASFYEPLNMGTVGDDKPSEDPPAEEEEPQDEPDDVDEPDDGEGDDGDEAKRAVAEATIARMLRRLQTHARKSHDEAAFQASHQPVLVEALQPVVAVATRRTMCGAEERTVRLVADLFKACRSVDLDVHALSKRLAGELFNPS